METQQLILEYLKSNANTSSKEIFEGLNAIVSYATVKRNLSKLSEKGHIVQQGKAKNTRYSLSPTFNLFYPIDLNDYFSKEIDEREILTHYNFALITEMLQNVSLYTDEELTVLNNLQSVFTSNTNRLSTFEYHKDMERLAIDLSWKSSQIDNEFQIREALQQICDLINNRKNIFEKALYALVLLSYLQAFTDGNKRMGRITSNAILIANRYCPISFRTVDSIDYKKSMLLFYEQNNISAFKQIFINQFKFAVENYF